MVARYATIEGAQEVPLRRQIVDVKRPGQKFAEWATYPRNNAKMLIGLAIIALIMPALLPLLLVIFAVLWVMFESFKFFLPVRYPAWADDVRDPGLLHPATDRPMKPEGIMYMGVVDASDPYWRNMQVFLSADDLKRHMLVLGTTGSGKSEFLKGITLNILAWGSGFFLSDAKADNKLPTDVYSQVRMLGRDYSFLVLNYLLGGLSPAEIAGLRELLSNGLQPSTAADADTLVQMTSNMMAKAGGDGKQWQERGLNLYRGICRALTHKRDRGEINLSMETLREHLDIKKIENLYLEGYRESLNNGGLWTAPYLGIRSYLEVGLPGYSTDVLFKQHNIQPPDAPGGAMSLNAGPGKQDPKAGAVKQVNEVFNQHGYRADQMYPALSLVIDTYGHIFKKTYPEIDMEDVVTNCRICVSLIPSLEKGSQEQESLGKLNLALLRVMMTRALGSSVEGDVEQIVDAKITNSPVPFGLLLDEFAYQFADGIALMTAQVRSLNFFLCALAQDLEKLTEGDRAAEAGAMMANQGFKAFMKIVGSDKTHDLAARTLGEAEVAIMNDYEREEGGMGFIRARQSFRIEKRPRMSRNVMERLESGFAAFFYRDRAHIMRAFYVSDSKVGVPRVRYPRLNRFLQIRSEGFDSMMLTHSVQTDPTVDKNEIEELTRRIRTGAAPTGIDNPTSDVIQSIADAAAQISPNLSAIERGIVLYQAGVDAVARLKTGATIINAGTTSGGRRSGGPSVRPAEPPPAAPVVQSFGQMVGQMETGLSFATAPSAVEAPQAAAAAPAPTPSLAQAMDFESADPFAMALGGESPLEKKPKAVVFQEAAAPTPTSGAAPPPESAVEPEPDGDLHREPEVDLQREPEPDVPALVELQPEDFIGTEQLLPMPDAAPAVAPPKIAAPAPAVPGMPVADVMRHLSDMSMATVPATDIERMGNEVVGLRDNVLAGIQTVEMAMGATADEASATSESVERAVASNLSYNAAGTSSGIDMDSLFAELEHVVRKSPE